MKMKAALLGAVAVLGLAPAAFAERGADGEVKLTFPQAVSIVNPYLSGGTKDILAAAMVLEPLAGDQGRVDAPYIRPTALVHCAHLGSDRCRPGQALPMCGQDLAAPAAWAP